MSSFYNLISFYLIHLMYQLINNIKNIVFKLIHLFKTKFY